MILHTENRTKKDICKVYRNGVISVIEVDNSALNGEAVECKKFSVAADTEFAEEITGDVLFVQIITMIPVDLIRKLLVGKRK